jgi:two-component system OmpR family response regulator
MMLEIDVDPTGWLPTKLSSAGFEVQLCTEVETSLNGDHFRCIDGIFIETGALALSSPIVAKLRSAGILQPIIVIASHSNWRDAVANLDSGADGYVVKPARSEEIAARMRAAIRRAAGFSTSQLTVGRLAFDLNSKMVWLDGQRVDVTRNEFRLLRLLLLEPENVFSAEQIRDALVHHGPIVSPNALEVQIARLRKKLGADLIKTIRGVGYRINGDVLFLENPAVNISHQESVIHRNPQNIEI